MTPLPQHKFTGRKEYIELFLDKLITPQSKNEYRLLNFYGVGGQGKSALFDYLQDSGPLDQDGKRFSELVKQKSKAFDYKLALVDFNNSLYRQSFEALIKLRIDFLGSGIDFFRFDLAFTIYLARVYPHMDMMAKYAKLFRGDNEYLYDFANIASVGVAIVNPPAALAITLVATLGKHLNRLNPKQKSWYLTEGKTLENQLNNISEQDLLDQLPALLGEDIRKAVEQAKTPRLVIMMDTYEALWGPKLSSISDFGYSDKWVRDLVTASPGILFAFLGKEKLNWAKYSQERPSGWNYTKMLESNQILLKELADKDADALLISGGIGVHSDNVEIREIIKQSSQGLPFYLIIQLEQYRQQMKSGEQPKASDFGGTKQRILDRFISYLSDHEKDALFVVGQARKLNKSVFELLKKEFFIGAPTYFNKIVGRSFFDKIDEENYVIHQLMQEHLEATLSEADLDRYNEIHSKLFEHYDIVAEVKDIKTINQEQKDAFVEANYHKQKFGYSAFRNWFYKREQPFNKAGLYNFLIPLHRQRTNFCDSKLGIFNTECSKNRNDLFLLLEKTGENDEAEFVLKQVFENLKKHNLNSINVLNNLAMLYESQGRYKEAAEKYQLIIDHERKNASTNNPNHDHATHLSNYASLLIKMDEEHFSIAEVYLKTAIEIDEEIISKKTKQKLNMLEPDLLNSLLETILISNKSKNTPNMPSKTSYANGSIIADLISYATHLNILVELLEKTHQFEEANSLCVQILKIDKITIAENHPEHANHLNNYALVLEDLGYLKQALEIYSSVLQIDRITVGEKHQLFARTLNNIAFVHVRLNNLDIAKQLYERAIEICELSIGGNHPDTLTILENYQDLLSKIAEQNLQD